MHGDTLRIEGRPTPDENAHDGVFPEWSSDKPLAREALALHFEDAPDAVAELRASPIIAPVAGT